MHNNVYLPTTKQEKLVYLILEELKLIRKDIKTEVRRLGQEIKLLYVSKQKYNKDSSFPNPSNLDFTDVWDEASDTRERIRFFNMSFILLIFYTYGTSKGPFIYLYK